MLINDIANIEKQISQFEFEKNKTNDEIEKARKEIANVFEERGIETKSVITKPSSLGVHLI